MEDELEVIDPDSKEAEHEKLEEAPATDDVRFPQLCLQKTLKRRLLCLPFHINGELAEAPKRVSELQGLHRDGHLLAGVAAALHNGAVHYATEGGRNHGIH